MEWILDNLNALLSVVSAIGVLAVFLYLRYCDDRRRLEEDLRQLVRDGIEFLKHWAGDNAATVTQEQVWQVADWFYSRCVIGTPLERVVSKETLRALFWSAFCRWRDQFLGASAVLPACPGRPAQAGMAKASS